jgi:hypothetical protein
MEAPMRRSRVWWFVCLVAVLALSPAWTLAEGEKKAEDAKKAESEKKADEKAELPAVITNETLERFRDSSTASPAPSPARPAAAKPKATAKPGDPGAAAPGTAKAEEEMSPAERAKRIAEIDAELERLNRRTLALKNPLLRGTVPPTEDEKQAERGMNNIEMLQSTEKRIAELKAEKQELQSR